MRKLLLIIGLSLASRAAYGQCSAFAFNPFTGKLDCVGVNSITPGTGDVVGPASSTTNHIPQYSNTTGKLLKDGLALVTTVGSPGADTAVPTEAAVRTAIAASGGVAFTGTQTADALVTRAGSANQIKNPIATSTLDASGNFSTAGGYTAGAGGAAAGFLDLGQGTAPASPASGHFQLTVATISTPYAWTVPAADAAGAVASNGAGALSLIGFSGTGNIARVGSPTFTGSVAAAVLTLSGALSGTSASFSGALTTNLTGGGTQCVHVSNTGVLTGTGSDCGSGGGGSGTVTHTAGALTATALVAGNGGADVATPSATATLDSSGNIVTPGGITTGSGGSNAGYAEFGQGTAPSITANAVQLAAPASVTTGWLGLLPAAPATGFFLGTNASSTVTFSFVASSGSGSVIRGTSPTMSGVTLSDVTGSTQCLHVNSAGLITGTGSDCGAGGGSGTVTHTAGALTSTALVTGNGGADIQTASATATMDSSGNISTPGTIAAGVGGSAAGALDLTAGTAPSAPATSHFILNAPTTITTPYRMIVPQASLTGLLKGTDASNVNTLSFITATGSSTDCLLGTLAFGACPGGGGSGTVTSSGSPLIHQVAIFTTATDIKGIAVGATDKPLVGVTGADAVFSKLTLTNPATAATITITDNKTFAVSNTLTLAGTDSTTMTFPSTSATIARTDAANTFSGHQTIEGVTSTGATGTGNLVFATTPTLTTPRVTTVNDANGNPFIASTATASAVDGITVTNAASANPATVKISATSTVDSNINLELDVKGSGVLQTNATTLTIGVGSGQAAVLDLSATTATFSGLGSVLTANGQIVYCSDCTVTSGSDNTCASGGSGAVVARANSVNVCTLTH